MAQGNPEIKDIERVEVAPAGGDEPETEETEPESSPANEGEAEAEEAEAEPEKKEIQTPVADPVVGADGLKDLPGETPRERALRAELKKERDKNNAIRRDEILGNNSGPRVQKKELSDDAKKVLGKYKPEELSSLREVLPLLAEEMGFVKADDLAGSTFAEKSQEELDSFMEKHPEYTPEKDPDGTLWNAFKAEFSLYKTPTSPKEYRRIFEKAHQSVFGIQPAGDNLAKINAGQRKAAVAAHAGASGPARARPQEGIRGRGASNSGLRLDMLKGFSEAELADLEGSA